MGLPRRTSSLSPTEYLQIERSAEYRSEFFAGEIFAMAGGSPRHSLIKMNVGAVLRDRLLDRPCTPYDSDLRIRTPSGLYTYPDVSVICGELVFDNDQRDTVLNPTVIVEVLSPSTEAYDRGKKFEHYRRIESLREYILVSQDSPRIEKFSRNEDGTWTLTIASEMSDTVLLDSVNMSLPLAEVFVKVNFTNEDATAKLTDPQSDPAL